VFLIGECPLKVAVNAVPSSLILSNLMKEVIYSSKMLVLLKDISVSDMEAQIFGCCFANAIAKRALTHSMPQRRIMHLCH
jgi:hypothetical protein